MFTPDDVNNENYFQVMTLFRPIVPNNEDSLQVFDNFEQMLVLIVNYEREEEMNAFVETKDEVNYFYQGGILNLKNNYFP